MITSSRSPAPIRGAMSRSATPDPPLPSDRRERMVLTPFSAPLALTRDVNTASNTQFYRPRPGVAATGGMLTTDFGNPC